MQYNLLVVLGATATGKTSLAVNLAKNFDAEIISADSRQIYRGMDLGTGKDIEEYTIDGQDIPHHLIDIADAGYKYNVYEFQRDFVESFESIQKRNRLPLVCGGTGMYLEACLKGYKLISVPKDQDFRDTLLEKDLDELAEILTEYKEVHNNSDLETKKRAIRAIEIERYYASHPEIEMKHPELKPLLIGIKFDREDRRSRITQRLKERLESGMVEEVKGLIDSGVSPDDLIYYGLEYKFLTRYVIGELSYDEMFSQLEIAIHQFAKRQMTWFRKMERNGFQIYWLDGFMPLDEKIKEVEKLWNS